MTTAPQPARTPTDRLRRKLRDASDPGLRDGAMTASRGQQATLAEVFADTAVDAAPVGFVLAHLRPGKPVLWVQDRLSVRETGRPCLAGLPAGIGLIHVLVNRPADLLWTLEEGLECRDLGGVVGEIWGDPAPLDFTATKRLALRAEAHGVPCWLIRRGAQANLSAARERWRVASLPALPDPDDLRAPGAPLWSADLFRSRWRPPGHWVAQTDPDQGLRLDHGTDTGPRDQDQTLYG